MVNPGLLSTVAKARLFDLLIASEPHLSEGLRLLARDRALALITIHESGFRPAGRAWTQADFGFPEISAALEILSGEPLQVGGLIQDERMKIQGYLGRLGMLSQEAEVL